MAEKQLGRVLPHDRPGLASVNVATIADRDALTKIGSLDISADDVGRVVRVGEAAPYRYFEITSVGPLAFAEIGAPADDGDAAPPAPAKYPVQWTFGHPGASSLEEGGVLASVLVPDLPGAFRINQQDIIGKLLDTDESGGSMPQAQYRVGFLRQVGNPVSKSTGFGLANLSFPVESQDLVVYGGDHIDVVLDSSGDDLSYLDGHVVTGVLRHDPEAPNLGVGFVYQGAMLESGRMTAQPFVARGNQVSAVSIRHKNNMDVPPTRLRVAIYTAVQDADGNYVPDQLLGSAEQQTPESSGLEAIDTTETSFDSPIDVTEGEVYMVARDYQSYQSLLLGGSNTSPVYDIGTDNPVPSQLGAGASQFLEYGPRFVADVKFSTSIGGF